MVEVAEIFNPPKKLTTKAFLETEFTLPDFGEYDFYYTPYFLGVALALDDPEAEEIDLMKAAQIGWTYFLLGYIFKRIGEADFNPCPILALFAKTGDAKNFHDEKLVPAAQATKRIAERMDVATTRKSGNRWDNKTYPGGFLKLVGSNSPGNVKSTSKVGVGIVEEPDDTQDNVAGQGDAIGLLEERLKRYIGSKLIVGGTPAVKGLSKTESRLAQTDKRVLPIKCHDCGEKHSLSWSNVVWDTDVRETAHPVYGKDDPESAVYVCPHCGSIWDDYQRQENIRTTCFDAYSSGDPLAGWQRTAEFHGKAGFMGLSELYVCMPGTSLADVVGEYLYARSEADKGNQTALIKFVNQKLGESYEYQDDNATAEELRAKAEDYPELVVPRGGLIITAGIDIQRDRIAITLYAWGRDSERWNIFFGEIWAQHNINDINDPVWSELDRLLFGVYEHETGAYLSISAASLDTSDGVTQAATYHYVRTRQRRGVNLMGIKGANSIEAPAVTIPKKQDLNATKTNADKYGLKLWIVGTQAIKDSLAAHLKLTGTGPNRIHLYTGVRDDFFEQMTGEIKAPHRTARNKLIWQQKSGQPVEGWDCTVYATHAGLVEKLHTRKTDWWDRRETTLIQGDLLGGSEQPDNLVTSIEHRPEGDEQASEITSTPDKPAAAKPIPVAARSPRVTTTTQTARPTMAELARRMGNN